MKKFGVGHDLEWVAATNLCSQGWTVTDFITDGTWRKLDCSSVVPEEAIAILFEIELQDDVALSQFSLRKNGNSNIHQYLNVFTLKTHDPVFVDRICACGANRVIEYYATNTTFTVINLEVGGWFRKRR